MTEVALADPRRGSTMRLSAMALGAMGVALMVLVLAVAATKHSSDPANVHPGDETLTFDASSPTTVAKQQKLTQQQLRQLDAAQNNKAQSPIAIVGIPVPVGQNRTQGTAGSGANRSVTPGAAVRTTNGPSAPVISDFYPDSSSPAAKQDVTFHWFAGDNDGLITAYTVDFGDGAKDGALVGSRCVANPTDPVTERPPFHHAYDTIGTFRVKLKVFSAGSCGDGPTQTALATYDLTVSVVPGGPGFGG